MSQSTISRAPYEDNIDELRVFDVECRTCGETARLYCYVGRDWPWKHDMVHDNHAVEYRSVDTDTDRSEAER